MSKSYLRVKVKSLAAESRIIRMAEGREKDEATRNGLHDHRVRDVREESRSALLAYAFLRNRPYSVVERVWHREADWPRVIKIVQKYGFLKATEAEERIAQWRDANVAQPLKNAA